MNFINQINALYKGELLEKLKRLFLKKTKLIEKKYKLPKEIHFDYNNYCKNRNDLKSVLVDFDINFSKYNLMNKYFDIYNYSFKDNSDANKWFYLSLPKGEDIKVEWEINRLQFLPLMALKVLKEKNQNDLEIIKKIIKEWNQKNPYDIGINWYSNLEVAIRSISFLLTYIILDEHLNSKDMEELIFKHGFHIYKDIDYTEKCIPNNHLIGEAASLYILGNIFQSDYSEQWISKSKKILKKYISLLRDDGTYEEASLSYHRFVLQMYLLVYLFSKKFKDNFIEKEFVNKMTKSYIFLKSIEKKDKSYPQFGDWDDGLYYKLDSNRITDYYSFVETIGYFFDQNKPTIENIILESLFGKIEILKNININNYHLFEKGKYGIYKDEKVYLFINNQEQFFHSHSDGLSIELSINGQNILTDSGTYSYNKDYELRKYFRSTKSHNTVYLGMDQATQVGSFRWVNQPKTFLRKSENETEFEGYIKTKDNSKHKRTVKVQKNEIIIKDEINSKKEYFEINYHFGTDIEIKKTNEKEILINDRYRLSIESEKDYKIKIEDSYYSESYNKITKRKKLKILSNNREQTIITRIVY